MTKFARPLLLTIVLGIVVSLGAYSQEFPPEVPGVVNISERKVPPPYGISPELLEVVKTRQIRVAPVPKTQEEWLQFVEVFNEPANQVANAAIKRSGASYEVKEIAGARCYVVIPKKIDERFADRTFIHTHGGAFVFGGGDSALREAVWLADGLNVRVISIDYRKPPLHPFPAAIDDAVAVWREVIKDQDAEASALFGTSAGGNIALTTTLKLKDLGLPLPGAIFAGTPATDLENKTDTWFTLAGLDPLGQREGLIQATFELYAGSENLSNPLLSPVNGDLSGFPPTLLISGTRDLLLSDTVRMHRALRSAGVRADLHVYDGQAHGDYIQGLIQDIPESEDALRELYDFFDEYLE